MKRIPRYRMRMHEKQYMQTFVNGCLDTDVKDLEDRVRLAINILDDSLGDTDPDEIDYYEFPIIRAMHLLLGVIDTND